LDPLTKTIDQILTVRLDGTAGHRGGETEIRFGAIALQRRLKVRSLHIGQLIPGVISEFLQNLFDAVHPMHHILYTGIIIKGPADHVMNTFLHLREP